MSNDDVVIDRLEGLKRSLERALEGVERELAQRRKKGPESYRGTYLSGLSDLQRKAAALEDEIHGKLSYA